MDKLLENLLTENLDKIYRFSFNKMKDSSRSEDLAHDIITEIICAYPKLRDNSKITAWMWGIAKNVYLRTLYVNSEISLDETLSTNNHSLFTDDFIEQINKEQEVQNIRRALAYLAKRYREILILFYVESKSYKEISAELGIPMSSVKWRLSESKKVLKEEYNKMEKFMSGGFCFAQNMHVVSSVYNATNDNYLIPRRALKSLLSKNIALCAYETPATVTEISEKLGVSAEYVEDVVNELVLLNLMEQVGNSYQTTFPIISQELDDEICNFVAKRVAAVAPTIISYAKDCIGEFEKIKLETKKYQYPYHDIGAGESNKVIRMLLSQAYNRTQTIDTREFPFTEGGYYSVIAHMNMDTDRGILGFVNFGTPQDEVTGKRFQINYFTSDTLGIYDFSCDTIKILGRIFLNAPIDDIPNYKSILADLIQNEIIIKTDEGYTLNVYVTVIPDFMDSNDPLWYETGEHFSQNNLRVFKSFAHPTRKIIDNLENDIVAFLRKKIPSNIKFLRPIAYEYMTRIYDKQIFAYAEKELGITLKQKDLIILEVE